MLSRKFKATRDDVTIADEGDLISPEIPVEALRAYSMGRLPLAADFRNSPALAAAETVEEDNGRRVRVAEVKVNGEWVPL